MMWRDGTSRRDLLKSLGLGGAGYFLPAMRAPAAQAAEAPRLRVVVLYAFQGWYYPECFPVGADGRRESAGGPDFNFTATHEPVNAWKDYLAVPNGVKIPQPGKHTEGAHASEVSALTANGQSINGKGATISIDQFIAKELNKPRPLTPLRSLDLQVQSTSKTFGISNFTYASIVEPGVPTPLEPDPAKVWTRLFPDGPQTGMGDKALSEDALAAFRQQRRSVLDFIAGEFSWVKNKVSSAQWQKLEQHADLIRAQEQKIDLVKPVAPANHCTSTMGPKSIDNLSPGDEALRFKTLTDAQVDNIRTAFACDLTRVALLNVYFPPGPAFGWKRGDFGADHEHDYCHKWQEHDQKFQLPGRPLAPKDEASKQTLMRGYRIYAEIMAQLMEKLHEVKEEDGKSVLDNTVIIWTNQLGTALHDLNNSRYLLAGKLGGRLKTGRYYENMKNVPVADLYSTVTHALGLGTFRGKPLQEMLNV